MDYRPKPGSCLHGLATIFNIVWLTFLLLSSPPYIPVFSTAEDLLHVLHQGVAGVVVASLICDHLEAKHAGITLKQMDALLSGEVFEHYKGWCAERSPLVSMCSHRFNLSRFGKEKWSNPPELQGIYKASVVKTLMFWCADYLKSEGDGVVGGDLRIFTMHALAKFQLLLDVGGPWFSEQESQKVVTYGWAALMFFQQLTAQDRCRNDGRRSFKITPKFHSFVEMQIYIQTTRRNPRFFGKYNCFLNQKKLSVSFSLSLNFCFWNIPSLQGMIILIPSPIPFGKLRFEHCYQDEDLMKQIGKIASMTHVATLEKVTMERYAGLLELQIFGQPNG